MGAEVDPTRYRSLLFAIAYRMTGSVQDSEDLVQETYLRWTRVNPVEVRSPKEYLCTTVTRLAIDHLRSARVRRETYVGAWLPEPLLEAEPGPEEASVMHESVSTAFLLVLESLNPLERAAFLLRQVFDYEYDEIARILQKSEANCRQMVHRARERLAERRPRFDADPSHAGEVARRFLDAMARGDMAGLLSCLSADVTAWADGGGRVRAALAPIRGAETVARYLLGLVRLNPGAASVVTRTAGGHLAVITYQNGQPISLTTFGIAGGKIHDLYLQVNPDKLTTAVRSPH